VQTLNYPGMVSDLLGTVRALRSGDGPVSVCCHPLPPREMVTLKKAGVCNMCIPLDAAAPDLFELVKGSDVGNPYTWEGHLGGLRDAVGIFGPYHVTSHVIVGLGESDEALVGIIQRLWGMGVVPALFALWDRQPSIGRYRAIQLARYLIVHGYNIKGMGFGKADRLKKVACPGGVGDAFKTSGCEGCNRPFYNERAGGPLYNYPRDLTPKEVGEAVNDVNRYLARQKDPKGRQ